MLKRENCPLKIVLRVPLKGAPWLSVMPKISKEHTPMFSAKLKVHWWANGFDILGITRFLANLIGHDILHDYFLNKTFAASLPLGKSIKNSHPSGALLHK